MEVSNFHCKEYHERVFWKHPAGPKTQNWNNNEKKKKKVSYYHYFNFQIFKAIFHFIFFFIFYF